MIGLLLFLSSAGCSSAGDPARKPDLPPAEHKVSADPQSESALSGKIVETMNSGGYTYINLERKGETMWVAVPKMDVKVGQEISLSPGMEMRAFKSKSLNRTFDRIIFSSGPVRKGAGEDKPSQKATIGQDTKAEPLGDVKVDKASGPDAYTVAELYRNKDMLDKKEVAVRGKVVKVSSGIMGKNWIHLQDGSGSPADKSNDLVVTSQDLPAAGETVTARGTLYKDRDFGSGYRFSVIIENARMSK